MAERFSSRSFAACAELRMIIRCPNMRSESMSPSDSFRDKSHREGVEICAPYFWDSWRYPSHCSPDGKSNRFPMSGRGFGPGGNGRCRRRSLSFETCSHITTSKSGARKIELLTKLVSSIVNVDKFHSHSGPQTIYIPVFVEKHLGTDSRRLN